mgnify:CR=1 FL=1
MIRDSRRFNGIFDRPVISHKPAIVGPKGYPSSGKIVSGVHGFSIIFFCETYAAMKLYPFIGFINAKYFLYTYRYMHLLCHFIEKLLSFLLAICAIRLACQWSFTAGAWERDHIVRVFRFFHLNHSNLV